MRSAKVIYSINIEDVQNVAQEELGRLLTDMELEIVQDKLGDYIQWYDAIASVVAFHVQPLAATPTEPESGGAGHNQQDAVLG